MGGIKVNEHGETTVPSLLPLVKQLVQVYTAPIDWQVIRS